MNMQKVASKALGVLLVLCMLLGLLPAAAMAADAPSDISGHWAQSQLQSFVDAGYLKGYEDGTYRPNNQVTRAEFSALLNRVAGLKQESADIQRFVDVSANQWYYADLAKGLAAGYIAGTTPTTMEPNANATREQAFTMLARLLNMTNGDTAVLSRFADGGSVSGYARGCVAALTSAGIVNGYPNATLLPQGALTRAEAVMILSACEDILQGKTPDVKPGAALKDGVYTGVGTGYGGDLTVTVTVSGGRITAIEIGENKETEIYLNSARSVIDQILANQGTDGVDAVSGATYSSYGIINAVKDALKDAEEQAAATIEVADWKEFTTALAAARDGDTIKLTADIANAGDAFEGALADAVSSATLGMATINKAITIDGNGKTISAGQNTTFCFNVTGSGIVVQDLTIEGASYGARMGGGMYVAGNGASIELNNVTFKNCASYKATMAGNGGGAIYAKGDVTVTAENCTFDGNAVVNEGFGGAILAQQASVVLSNCIFTNNSAKYGGAIAANSTANLTVTGCTFERNDATYGGDDIYIVEGKTNFGRYQGSSDVSFVLSGNTYDVDGADWTDYAVILGRFYEAGTEPNEKVLPTGHDLTFTSIERTELKSESEQAYRYVLMNIPYADFYAGEVKNDVAVDAVSSATKAKTMSGSLVAGSYHVNADGSDITGITYPVAVPADADLSAYTQITDADSFDITVTNRGQTTTTTYAGKDALFGKPSYSYYVLAEAPVNYKILSVGEDGTLSFSKAQGVVTKVSDVTASFLTESSYGDFQLNLVGFHAVSDDTIYGVILTTDDGTGYGLRHLENVWLKTELAWSTGFTTAVHGSPTSFAHYVSMMGKTITSVTYMTSSGIYEIPVDVYVPVKFENDLAVEDADVTAKTTAVSVTLPEAFEPALAVLDATGKDVTETYGFALNSGKLTWKTEPLPAVYTVKLSDAQGVYLAVSATCTLSSSVIPAAYDADTRSLVAANGSSDEEFANYLSALKEITVNGISNKVEVAGHHGTTITYTPVINSDGTIALDGGMFTGMAAGKQYTVVATATAYTEPLTFTVTIPETLYGTAALRFAEFYSGDVSSTDGYGVDGIYIKPVYVTL